MGKNAKQVVNVQICLRRLCASSDLTALHIRDVVVVVVVVVVVLMLLTAHLCCVLCVLPHGFSKKKREC